MASLGDVFRVLAQMGEEGVVTDYAIGDATAVLFYAEPTRTYDVDVFALLPSASQSLLVSLAPVYRWAEAQGYTVDAEHVLGHGVPVQILPAYNALVVDAIHTARVHEYQGIPVRVVDPEHLIVLALQAGGARRRERAWLLLQTGIVDRPRLRALLNVHGIDAEIPADD
jgi:Nucleotidyl transferase of unknown function (DUF2204)